MPQYVNKSEENINTGKFSPSVNYSQIEPRKENYRVPYVAPYDDTDNVGNFANSYANSYKVFAGSDKKEKEDDKGLRNQLAMNFNTIAERQRQGRISVSEAENYYRKLSNDYIAAGADEKTVNDVLKRYSWGVTSNEEARQKELMENEMSNRKAYIDSLRENNPAFRGKSYEYIEDILANANQSYDDAKRYQRMTAQMSPESSEYRVNHSMMMDSATKNADVRFKILVDQAMTAGQPINKEFINAAEVNVRRSLMDPQGLALDQDTAIAVAERALNNTPFTQMANDVDSAYKYSTETYKTIVDNIKAGAEYQLYKDPNVANLMTIGGEPMKQAIVDQVIINHKDALVSIASNVTNGVEIKKDNITPDIVHELPTLIKGYENALRVEGVSTDFSKGSLGARVLEVYNGAYSFDPVNYTQQDLDNISRNYEELERRGDIKLAEKAVDKGLKSDDPKIREQWEKTAEELNKAKGTKIAANMLSATRNVKPSPAMRISGTVAQERVHYDPATGKAYLVEPEGFIQTTGEVFNKLNMSSSEYQTAVSDLNKQLSVLDKDTRIATMKALGYKEGVEGASEVTPTTSGMTQYNAPLGQSGYGQLGAAMQNVNNSEKLSNGPLADPERVRRELQAAQANTATASLKSSETLAYADITQGHLPTAAEKHGVPSKLLDAIFKQESSRGTNLKSKTGVEGAMQITKDTWNNEIAPELGFTEKDFYDPRKHMEGGAYYFSKQLKAFNGDEAKALAAYNGGASVVRKAVKEYGEDWLNHIEEFSIGKTKADKNKKGEETKQYVKNILAEFYSDNDEIAPDYRQNLDRSNEEYVLKFQIDALSDAIANNKLDDTQKQLLQSYLERLSRQLRATKTAN